MEEFEGLSTQKDESLGTSFALNKESSNNDLLRYFKAILKLQKLNESFPVNIDEVWMLVYTNRNKAIYSLRSNFIEGEDFNLYQMGKVVSSKELRNGIKIDAKLSVSCMEYFVARKSRSVFEVYRKVFHKTAEILQEPSLITSKQINAKISWIKGCKNLLRLNENSTLLLLKQVGDPLGLPTPDYTSSNGILRSASELLKKNEKTLRHKNSTKQPSRKVISWSWNDLPHTERQKSSSLSQKRERTSVKTKSVRATQKKHSLRGTKTNLQNYLIFLTYDTATHKKDR